ncbi:MAG TPA: glycosyltransferase family 4 protein [Fimbriiglobus sp.]|nr:glycosyltransferase family 4 protein [Fimbriiglobus sp.]
MRIAWFTPFTPLHAIGDYSEAIVRRLAVRDEVTVFAPADVGGEAPRPSPLPVVPIPHEPTPDLLARLDGFDVCVYNLGDHIHNHLAVYETALRRPGITVLHDLMMRDFFLGYFVLHRKDPAGFARLLGYAHGPEAEALGRDVVEGRRPEEVEDPVRLTFPMYKPALRRALGVVVHSEYARGRVAPDVPAPVRRIDFPLFGPAARTAEASPARPPSANGKVRLLTFGMLNPNKLVHATIEAIAGSDRLRRAVQFTVVGSEGIAGYEGRLRGLIADQGLGEAVSLVGRLSDDELRAALAEADVVVNLRNPHGGESSASLLTSLVAGVPTVVWDHGYYGEFPDDVVVKVRSEAEIAGALEGLVGDPARRQRIGKASRAHALARFDTDRYCQQFREFAGQVRQAAPLFTLTDAAADRLAELGSSDLDGLADRIAAEVATFVPEVPSASRATTSPIQGTTARSAAA